MYRTDDDRSPRETEKGLTGHSGTSGVAYPLPFDDKYLLDNTPVDPPEKDPHLSNEKS